MLAIKVSVVYLIVTVAISQQVVVDEERPFLRILAPKFLCNQKKEKQDARPSNSLTIGLQTREGQKLRYKISVDFEMLDGFKSQKHTLSIWKNIRMLQRKFANISDEISMRNQIEINGQELTPQVIYTFKITGYDEKNLASETQNFTITFKGGELKAYQPHLGDGVSLLLLSSQFFYDDMEMLAVAEVTFCEPVNDFSFRWKIVGHELSEVESVSGNSLKLPSGLFKPGKLVEVIVAVLNKESLTMASATLPVKILAKEFQLHIAPSQCLVGTGREIPFQVLISRESATAVESSKWTCSKDGLDCLENFVNTSLLNQQISFSEDGSYELKSEFSIYDVTKSVSSKVGVDKKVIPHVQLKYIPPQPVNVMTSIEIVVTVLNLIPKCVAYWNLVHDEGFAMFKSGSEGNFTNMGMIVIKDFEEYFLQELVDYDNNTLSKDVTLSVPKEVLLPSEKYKFRLTASCPEPLTDSKPQTQNAHIISFYDIVFDTNAPPELFPLDVTPLFGIPMKQKFKFSTGAAKDASSDFPLKYTFGYVVNGVKVIIGSFYENTVAHTQLPFSGTIETFCEVCDNNGACAGIAGPTIAANQSYIYSHDETEFKLEEFRATLKRAEYSDASNSVVTFLLTQREVSEETPTYEATIISMMKAELEKLKSTASSGFIYHQKVIEFVKMTKIIMSIVPVFDETFVFDLLSLTETISRSAKRMKRVAFPQNSYAKVVSHDTDYIKNVLGLSEMLLNSKNATIVQREKGKFVAKVHQFIGSMCQDKNLNSQFIETEFASFEVSKVFSPQLFVEAQKIPGAGESTILYNHNGNFPSKYVCVAKIRFARDMFKGDTNEVFSPVYETIILVNEGATFKPIKANAFSDGVTVEIGVSADTSAMTCTMWKDENWSPEECFKLKTNATNRIACKCKTSAVDGVVIKAGQLLGGPVQAGATTIYHAVTTTERKDGLTTPFTFLTMPTTMRTSQISSTTKSPDLQVFQPIKSPEPSSPATPTIKSPGSVTTITSSSLQTFTEAAFNSESESEIPASSNYSSGYNVSSENLKNVNDSSVSWIVIVLLVMFFFLILILVSAHKCRHYASSHMNLPMRYPATGIKYAKYHDEFTLQG